MVQVFTTVDQMVGWSRQVRSEGMSVGLVPTMGSLHRGHTSLMDQLRGCVDRLVVSIYVNPLQFGPGEDLDTYPRDQAGDVARCEEHGVDVVFAPTSMYPEGFASVVTVHGLTDRLCGAKRPGHFEGVCTVVTRLFGLTGCHQAVFGEKDFQQLAVLRRMARDLALPVEVLGGAIVRDDDGVALSSRNASLNSGQRLRATSLSRGLFAAGECADGGERSARRLIEVARGVIDCDRLDYIELVDAHSLLPVEEVAGACRMLVAGFYGDTRLIDNLAIGS